MIKSKIGTLLSFFQFLMLYVKSFCFVLDSLSYIVCDNAQN